MEILKKIFGLDARIWSASGFNVAAIALQLWTILSEKSATGVSLGMLLIFIYVQVTFAQVGWRTKTWGQFWGMTISAVLTAIVVVLTFVY